MKRKEQIDPPITDVAKRIVSHIGDRATDRCMIAGELTEATAGMLALLSILRWERKVGLLALERMEVDTDRLARELDTAISEVGQSTKLPGGPRWEVMPDGERYVVADFNTPLQSLLDLAKRQSQRLGHDWIGTEHLLFAAVESACPRLQGLLTSHKFELVQLRQTVMDILSAAHAENRPRRGG